MIALSPNHKWTLKSALEQITSCNFECEAGPLKNNVAWQWLINQAGSGPEFFPGQIVWYKLSATVARKTLSAYHPFTIVGLRMLSDTTGVRWAYDLSNDPPDAYHYGSDIQFPNVPADKLTAYDPTKLKTDQQIPVE